MTLGGLWSLIYTDVRSGNCVVAFQHSAMASRRARCWSVRGDHGGCLWGVSQPQATDRCLDLTGPETPAGKGLPAHIVFGYGSQLVVRLFYGTDNMLAGLLPALPDRLGDFSIGGKQQQLIRLMMYTISLTQDVSLCRMMYRLSTG